MRTRLSLLFVAIALMAVFVALNWSEFAHPVQLSWGWGNGEAPLGLIMLAILAVSWLGFLLGSAYLETHYQLAAHRNAKVLEAQRVLADKAEASRFIELRSYLESQAALAVQRDAAAATRMELAVNREQRELLTAIQRLSARLDTLPGDIGLRPAFRPETVAPH